MHPNRQRIASSVSKVGAYAQMSVAKAPLANGILRDISLSLWPLGVLVRSLRIDFRIANPTPWIRGSSFFKPFQKKVYPAPSSVSEPSSGSLVSCRAAISIL